VSDSHQQTRTFVSCGISLSLHLARLWGAEVFMGESEERPEKTAAVSPAAFEFPFAQQVNQPTWRPEN
jgi:hypothetical protein